MYDLHAHILPGVDDGAKTPQDTVDMARVAAENGTITILATPHRKDITENWSVAYIRQLVEDMNSKIRDEGIDLTLVLGMENHLDVDLPDEVTNGRALTVPNQKNESLSMPSFSSKLATSSAASSRAVSFSRRPIRNIFVPIQIVTNVVMRT